MTIVVLGIDLGKNVCSLVGLDANGAVVLRRRMRRGSLSTFVLSLPRWVVSGNWWKFSNSDLRAW